MARTQRVTIRETIAINRIPASDDDFIGDQVPRVPVLDETWESGTSSSEADLVANDYALSIAASSTASLDLDALAKGPEGGTVSFAEVRAILIRARSTNGGTVTLDPNASNGWTALGASFEVTLPAGSSFRLYSPVDGSLAVGASDKVLDITNNDSGAAALVDITIIGVSA